MKLNVWGAASLWLKYISDSIGKDTIPIGVHAPSIVVERVAGDLETSNAQGIYDKRWPVVIWHGLGDNYNSSGMVHMEEIINQIHPDVAVYRVRLNDDSEKDQQKSFVGDMNEYVDQVCEKLRNISELDDGFDGIGNSQGGLFLRALQEKCPTVSMHNLITFGSPHMGVMDIPGCKSGDWVCKRRNELLKRQVWNPSVQKTVVPAQYFRNPYDYANYVKHSKFLAVINNESEGVFEAEYPRKLKALNKFIMVSFASDTTVVPKNSSQFSDINVATGSVIPMRETAIYKWDLLGLKALDQQGKLAFYELEGDHMQISETFFVNIVNDYLGKKV